MAMYCLFFFLIFAAALSGKPLDVAVSANSAILMNAETGAILYEKHAHIPAYPASITKIATILFILDQKKIPLETLTTVSSESLKMKSLKNWSEAPAYWLESDGTKMGLAKGEEVIVEDLLHGLMLASGNDAANVLAETVSGSIPTFVKEMNHYLTELGCRNTQFLNPHGLHHPEHFTTAYDICLVTQKALQVPLFRKVVSTLSYEKQKNGRTAGRELRQHNKLLKPGRYYYPKAIGVKTGYTAAARDTLVAAAEHEGRTLIAVVMGCERKNSRYEDAIRLFETAFAEQKEKRHLLGPEKVLSRQVEGAKSPLKAALATSLEIEFFPAEEPVCKAALHWDVPPLPISKGQKVGEVRVQDDRGVLLKKGDLIAQEEVKATFISALKETFNKIFR